MNRILRIGIFLCAIFLSGCVAAGGEENEKPVTPKEPQALSEMFWKAGIEWVDRLDMQSGMSGEKKTTANQEIIQNFLAEVEGVIYTPDTNQEKREGWTYLVTLVDGENEFSFYPNHVEGVHYTANADMFEKMDQLFAAIESEEPIGARWIKKQSAPTLDIRMGSVKIRPYIGTYSWKYIDETTGEEVLVEAVGLDPTTITSEMNPPDVHLNLMTDIMFEYQPTTYEMRYKVDDTTTKTIGSSNEIQHKGPVIVEFIAEWEQGNAHYWTVLDIQ